MASEAAVQKPSKRIVIEEDSSSDDESDDEGGQTDPLPSRTTGQTDSQAMSPRDNTSDTRMYSCENCGLLCVYFKGYKILWWGAPVDDELCSDKHTIPRCLLTSLN